MHFIELSVKIVHPPFRFAVVLIPCPLDHPFALAEGKACCASPVRSKNCPKGVSSGILLQWSDPVECCWSEEDTIACALCDGGSEGTVFHRIALVSRPVKFPPFSSPVGKCPVSHSIGVNQGQVCCVSLQKNDTANCGKNTTQNTLLLPWTCCAPGSSLQCQEKKCQDNEYLTSRETLILLNAF